MPFAQELFVNLAGAQTLAFVIDGSEVGRKCLVLIINVIYRVESDKVVPFQSRDNRIPGCA